MADAVIGTNKIVTNKIQESVCRNERLPIFNFIKQPKLILGYFLFIQFKISISKQDHGKIIIADFFSVLSNSPVWSKIVTEIS